MVLWETERASEIGSFLEALANILAIENSKLPDVPPVPVYSKSRAEVPPAPDRRTHAQMPETS